MTDVKRCDIPSQTLGTCDLEWGHKSAIHSSQGDGFYSRKFEDEHKRRQAETGNAAKLSFHFSVSCDVSLTVEEIWPDGDAPENPTLDDVLKCIRECGGADRILDDWGLVNDLGLTVSDGKTSKDVP